MSESSHHYAVYGARLTSSIAFPELHETGAGPARWSFATATALPAMRDAVALGDERIYADVHARLFAHADGHRIAVDDTGWFDLSSDRRRVTWQERAESWPDFVRAHLLGRVLATALYLDGLLPLHGSGVETRDGVIAFLAPKGFGKSSLALALTAAGARLATDDTLPVEPGPSPRAWPGVHSVRVHADAVEAIGSSPSSLATREGKQVITTIAEGRRLVRPGRLAALYLLAPSGPDLEATVRIAAPPMLAAVGIVAHVKIGRMLGRSAAAPMLARAAAIAHAVPVFRLHTPRDLTRLEETAGAILDWHGRP